MSSEELSQYKSSGHFPARQTDGKTYMGKRSKPSSGSSLERRDFAYDKLLEGGTRHQITRAIHQEFTQATWDECVAAYYEAAEFLKQEQIETREILLDVLQAGRMAAMSRALRKGQLMAYSSLARDAGAVIGEAEREQQSQSVELKLSVQPPPEPLPGPSQAEPIDVTPKESAQKEASPAEQSQPKRIQGDLFG